MRIAFIGLPWLSDVVGMVTLSYSVFQSQDYIDLTHISEPFWTKLFASLNPTLLTTMRSFAKRSVACACHTRVRWMTYLILPAISIPRRVVSNCSACQGINQKRLLNQVGGGCGYQFYVCVN